MTKKIYILLIIFSMITPYFAQLTYVLKDNKNDVFGYAEISGINGNKELNINLRGEYNVIAKDIKLVLKDINLNIINDVLLKFDAKIPNLQIAYNKSTVIIMGISNEKGVCKECIQYFIYDLKTNKLSNLMHTSSNVFGEDKVMFGVLPIENVGYLFLGVNKKNFGGYSSYAINDAGKEIYQAVQNHDGKDKKNSFFLNKIFSEENLIILLYVDDDDFEKARYHALLLDANTGKEIGNILFDDEKYRYEPKTVSFKNNNIYIFGDLYKAGKKFDGGTLGYFMTTFDKKGVIVDKKIAPIADLKIKLDIDKDGEVKKKGFIYAHEFVIDDGSKNIVMVAEYLKRRQTGDLLFLEFDNNFKFKNSHEIVKSPNFPELSYTGSPRSYGLLKKQFGYFDYLYSGKLDKNKGLSFFYQNMTDEIIIGPFQKSKHNIGTVAYQNGTFTNNIISFSSKNPMSILPNKPGYFLLFESNRDSETEKRIEKINY